MFLASAVMVLAAVAPSSLPTPDDPVINIPGTTINVCVIADVTVLNDVTADLEAQIQVIVDDLTDQELLDLKAQCTQQVVVVPPTKVIPPPAGGDGGGTQVAPRAPQTVQVTQVPRGAPETGDGSTEAQWSPLVPVGFGALVLGAAWAAFGARGRGQAPARR